MSDKVSMSVVRRLPRYYRFLDECDRTGIVRISSRELAERMGLTASQIRQDLNCFGGFGQQGYGYNVPSLRDEIGAILGLNHRCKCILFGAGNLGRAIALHMNFESKGMTLIGIFDSKESYAGQLVAGMPSPFGAGGLLRRRATGGGGSLRAQRGRRRPGGHPQRPGRQGHLELQPQRSGRPSP